MFRRGPKRPRFSVGGHSVFDHDDSSNHSGLGGIIDSEEDSLSQQHSLSSTTFDSHFSSNQFGLDRPRRIQKPITKSHNDDNTNLNACIDHLFRILSRKDKEGFFQYPVTDHFAPGYSTIITRPMDFSTMTKKIKNDEYSNVIEFRSDFELMCDNAMKYNRPDTIYWRAAKKLLATGTKLMNKDKLLSFRRSLECFSRLTERELGFRIDSSNHSNDESTINSNEHNDSSYNDQDNLSSMSVSEACSQRKPKLILKLPKYYEKPPVIIPEEEEDEEEELPPEEILSQAQQAGQCARDKLNLKGLIYSYSLEYQRLHDSTALKYVNHDDFSEQIITLNETNNLIKNENDFLENGPFSSNSQQQQQEDSTFSSLAKEELDSLIHTYGSEFSAQYAISLMDYVQDAGDLALAYVDRLLSVLTNGEHDNFMLKKREKQQQQENPNENKILDTVTSNTGPSNDSTLTTEQIKTEYEITTEYSRLDTKLDGNSSLLSQLRQTQYDRLSQTSNQVLPPSSQQTNESINEYELTKKDLFNFNDMTQMSNEHEQIISSESVHDNLGIVNPNESLFDTF